MYRGRIVSPIPVTETPWSRKGGGVTVFGRLLPFSTLQNAHGAKRRKRPGSPSKRPSEVKSGRLQRPFPHHPSTPS